MMIESISILILDLVQTVAEYQPTCKGILRKRFE